MVTKKPGDGALDRPDHVPLPDPPAPDAAGAHTRTPQALGTEDPGQRRLGEPKPNEPSAAEDPNNPINQNADPEVAKARRIEGRLAERFNRFVERDKKGEYKPGLETIVARYLENHGRWQTETHRDHAGARQQDVLVGCACPICADARAALKLEV